MKINRNPDEVNFWLHQYSIPSYFETKNLPFFLVSFEKGEDVNNQMNPENYLLFLLKGQITIRHISEEGGYLQIARITSFSLLGDMEFVHPGVRQHLIEVKEDSLFAVLPLDTCREQLKKDPVFLFSLARSIEQKMEKAGSDTARENLQERFLNYLSLQKKNEISHVNETCDDLHCSRRQLQRVLHDLCAQGIIQKSGKGKYILIKNQ